MTAAHDVVVIGGGIVGLATAYQLLRRKPDLAVAVLEKEAEVASHQSGHNTGVIHAGIYYRPGSLRARLCREGKVELERFAEAHGIPYVLNGKLIVALDESQLGRLADLRERGLANGVQGLVEVGPERMREIEPHVAGIRALYSPRSGSIDFRRIAVAYADEVRARGGMVLTGSKVVGIHERGREWVLEIEGREEVRGANLIACAGLYSDRIAEMTGHRGSQRIVPFRGDYYTFKPEARHLVRSHINPVPDPRFPFLGIHFSRRIDGEVWAGPNAVLAFAREGYRVTDVSASDLLETLAFSGFRRLMIRYLGTGLREMFRDIYKPAFVSAIRRFLPEIRSEDLVFGPSGVRAQSLDAGGSLLDDFAFSEAPRLLHVRNAPSPGATSSLAIGRVLTEKALFAFGLA